MDALKYFQSVNKTGKKIIGVEHQGGQLFKIKYDGGGIGMGTLPSIQDEAQASVVEDMRPALIPYEEVAGAAISPAEAEMLMRESGFKRPEDYPTAKEELPWK